MAENYALYVSNCVLTTNACIRQAVEGFKVRFFAEDEGHTEHSNWIRFEIRWPDGSAKIDRMDNRDPEFAKSLREFSGFVREAAGGEMDARLWLIHEKILKTRNVLKMSAPPESAERLREFAHCLAVQSNGLLFHDSAIWDPKGRLCLDKDGGFDPDAGWDTLPSSKERKTRSEERLRQHGVPVMESLPPIEADEETLLRPPWEVARRASALVTVAARGEGLEQQRAVQFLQAWGLWDAASPKEQSFLLNPHPAETDRIQSLWRYECLWVMLWALCHIEPLDMPNSVCDVRRAVKIVTGTSTDVFIGKSNLRPLHEIMDEADFIYRCHWAVKNAQINGEAIPAGLDPGVVIERHIALNWLRTYHSQCWDDVSPDT
jgi:hypothetical protein